MIFNKLKIFTVLILLLVFISNLYATQIYTLHTIEREKLHIHKSQS